MHFLHSEYLINNYEKMSKLIKFQENWISLDIKIDKDISWKEDIWLKTNDIANLFWKDNTVITRHINNIFKNEEVPSNSFKDISVITEKNGRKWKKKTKEYNLDVILSVWYKVNWQMGTKFRRWANQTLWQYLKKWYVVNEKVILAKWVDEITWLLNSAQWMLQRWQSGQVNEFNEVLNIIKDYSYSFKTLQDYDEDKLSLKWDETGELKYILEYNNAIKYIQELKNALIKKGEATELFWQEKTHQSLWWIIWNIFNWFFGIEAYPSLEAKASHLLYFIIKNHPFNDWNKRIGAFIFQTFIKMNNFDRKSDWEKKINDTTLVAIALMIAESDPKQKETMTKLVINMLKKR
jgi:prophage maintenance system killer protein